MMKQSLMDMCVPVEQENKRELVPKFGTKKNHRKVVLFLYLNLKGSEKCVWEDVPEVLHRRNVLYSEQ